MPVDFLIAAEPHETGPRATITQLLIANCLAQSRGADAAAARWRKRKRNCSAPA